MHTWKVIKNSGALLALLWMSNLSAQTLPQQHQWTITGDDFMVDGRPLGDVNADGRLDVASILRRTIPINSPFFPFGVIGTRVENRVAIRSGADGSLLMTLGPFAIATQFFNDVEALNAGDVNGDGHDDIVISNSNEPVTGPNGTSIRSDVFVFSGLDGSMIHHWEPTNSPVFGYGTDISGGKDFDGDGVNDVLIGQAVGFNNGAILEIRSGANGAILQSLSVATGSYTSSDWMGDINSDGVLDVAVGTFTSPNLKGEVRVLSGLDNSVLLSASGLANMDYFGFKISNLGDVNSDSFDDLLVHGQDLGDQLDGRGWFGVFSGQDASLLYEVVASSPEFLYQNRRNSIGDLNGDGIADFSARFLIENSPGGSSTESARRIFSGADGSFLVDLPSRATMVSDTNGDGIPEFMWSTVPSSSLIQPVVTIESFMGINAYGTAPGSLTLAWDQQPQRPQFGDYVIAGASPNATILIAVSTAPANTVIGGTSLPLFISPLPGQLLLTVNLPANFAGQIRIFENLSKPAIAGFQLYLQVAETSPMVITSNALEVRFGP